jgi:hypothetical protein
VDSPDEKRQPTIEIRGEDGKVARKFGCVEITVKNPSNSENCAVFTLGVHPVAFSLAAPPEKSHGFPAKAPPTLLA